MQTKNQTLLIVEDYPPDSTTYIRLIEETDLEFESIDVVTTLEEAQRFVRNAPPSCCLVDFNLPDGNALAFINYVKSEDNEYLTEFPFIVITGQEDIQSAVKLLRSGASDYLVKSSLSSSELERSILHSLKMHSLQTTNDFLAVHDDLTGLFNRSYFMNKVAELITNNKRYEQPFALAYIDIDYFKQINDRYGHEAGDYLLKTFADELRKTVRNSDTVARIGGDEFAILFTDLEQEKAHFVTHKLVKKITHQQVFWEDTTLSMSISVGLACYPQDANDAKTLMRQADLALYESKKNGRGRYTSINKQLVEREEHDTRIREKLEEAIHQDRLYVAYQPVYRTENLEVVGVEALVRWQLDGQFISPTRIIDFVLDLRISHVFHDWLFARIFSQAKIWLAHYPLLTISVNFPTSACHDEHIVNQLLNFVDKYDIPRGQVVVEVTEEHFMHHPEKSARQLKGLADKGFGIAIDDFGSGYSSMRYLVDLPCTRLKIDKSFFLNLSKNKKNENIIRGVTALAHSLNLDVVAEGIESSALLEKAESLGCDYVQGFATGAPVSPQDDFAMYLAESRQAGQDITGK